jgi:hypothetical protein
MGKPDWTDVGHAAGATSDLRLNLRPDALLEREHGAAEQSPASPPRPSGRERLPQDRDGAGAVASRSELGPDLYAACVAGRSVAA